jgi:hypothetical protein
LKSAASDANVCSIMGEAGHVSAQFRRALDAGDFQGARMLAYELTFVPLQDALALTLLAAEEGPPTFEPMARRWLERVLAEVGPSIRDFAIASQLLADLTAGRISASALLSPLERLTEGKRLG